MHGVRADSEWYWLDGSPVAGVWLTGLTASHTEPVARLKQRGGGSTSVVWDIGMSNACGQFTIRTSTSALRLAQFPRTLTAPCAPLLSPPPSTAATPPFHFP
jgi:hypothetical protein